ncbi:MAG: hypothetical protein AUI36_46100 [Cyanobacteria bacterium 13_1_40CM_2_61_4]|nr:MAG: hypothetical protein AUI36_46100 [Cyanobacteria bacterium 13_1_40CM_2_61_4]
MMRREGQRTMAMFRPDILIQSPEDLPIAVVEVKNRQDLTREVATVLRRNIITHSLLPQTPYFLLISQDVGFLWKAAGPDAPPTYKFPMDRVVTRYLQREPGERLYGIELEFLVLQWLNDLASGRLNASEEPEKTLALAGFNDSIREATITIEEAA